MTNAATTVYEMMGGDEAISRIVSTFYDKVSKDPVLRPLFPEDFTEIRHKQYLFLTQFFGGPPLYSEQIGPPMMRARHLKAAKIEPRHAQAWLARMSEAMQENGIEGVLYDFVMDRLTKTAYHMVNHTEEGNPMPVPNYLSVDEPK